MTADQQQQIENLYERVNDLAVKHAETATELKGLASATSRIEGKLDKLVEHQSDRERENATKRGDRALGWVVNVVGWTVALLLLILKEVLAK